MLDYAGQNRCATKWLLEYPERRLDFLDRMGEFTALSATKLTGMPMGTDVGRPVESLGLSLARLEDTRLWITTIEDTEKSLGEKKLAFLNVRRWVHRQQQEVGNTEKGRPGWVDESQARYADWFYRRYGRANCPDPKTMTRWWDEIVNVAVRIAIARGCSFQK
ncbi:hypothetical protein [Anaeroselena agilis]|uniref:Uncharacterized protein n=1 Tax=Anaeroselena agilis TaxID=3063788 RepID=A0ABU3NTA8_9FIRM|nr:hypothetical protein [Selenomonadales bacterium 4137-cl]